MSADQVLPFVFDGLPVRGAVIQMSRSWRRMLRDHDYAPLVMETLGQAAAATGLIAQSLKFEGTVTLQIQGDGELRMLVMQSSHELEMRGMANAVNPVKADTFGGLMQKAHCAITIDSGERPYQGIVEISPDSLTASLEHYFDRSVQVPSLLTLFAAEDFCGGVLLQQMPDQSPVAEDDWNRLRFLLETLKASEMHDDDGIDLVRKLFAEDDVRVFTPQPVVFHCPCTTQRAEEVLRMLGEEEASSAVQEQGTVHVTCEYCGRDRGFDAVDISKIFAENVVKGSPEVQ